MSSIITTAFRFLQAETFINSFTANQSQGNLYLGISKPTYWPDEPDPDTPSESTGDKKKDWDEMIAMKKVTYSHIHNVIPRYDWIGGEYYTPYDDNDPNMWNKKFYVITESYNIYKCINVPYTPGTTNQLPSVYQPTNEKKDGTFKTPDGYEWKYMGRVENIDIQYLSGQWIPVKFISDNDEDIGRIGYAQYNVQQRAIDGTIDRIALESQRGLSQKPKVNSSAEASDGSLSEVVINIVGDGIGAQAKAFGFTDSTGVTRIDRIEVTNKGEGYTWAEITLTGLSEDKGDWEARAIISPEGGHGANIVKELGGFFTMITVTFDRDEERNVTIDNDYRKLILIYNPTDNKGALLTNPIYDLRMRLRCSVVSPSIKSDTLVSEKSDSNNGVTGFHGVLIDKNTSSDTKSVTLVNTSYDAQPKVGTILYPVEDNTINPYGQINIQEIEYNPYDKQNGSVKKYSGTILYKDYRKVISRADDQSEQINIIFEF